MFNSSNVKSSGFTYAGVHKNKKITASLVRFNNKDKNFKPDVIYEEDSNSMQSLGYVEDETMAFGITSEGRLEGLRDGYFLRPNLKPRPSGLLQVRKQLIFYPGLSLRFQTNLGLLQIKAVGF